MSQIGLILIIAGWAMQLSSKNGKIVRQFIVLYAAGVAVLIIDAFFTGLTTLAALNLISFVLALMVLKNVSKGKK